MPDPHGILNSPDRAVALAGALAETGVTRLFLDVPGSPRATLEARITDLPALLTQTAPGSCLSSPDGSIRVTVQPTHLEWACSSTDPGDRAAAFHRLITGR